MRDVVICEPLRTPVGRFGGVFRDLDANTLATDLLTALVERTGLTGGDVDDVILGQGSPGGEGPAIGRIAALDSPLGIDVPGMQLDRRCGSGLQAVITGALQGAGDTVTPLVILLVANVVNILCNYVFIFGVGPFPALGVQGAAVGTLVSRVLSAGAGLWVLASGRFALVLHWRRSWQVRWDTVGRILALGFPASLQGVTRNFGFMVMIKVLALTTAGTYAIAAYTVSMQIRMVTTMVGLALMAAATTAVGQNVGARNIERAGKSAWILVALAVGISTISGIIYATFGGYFTALFNEQTQVVAIGAQALLWLALSEPFLTAGMVLSGALRGAGDTISPLIISIISITVVGPLVAYLLAITLGMGTLGVWLGINAGIWLRIVLLVWQFQRGRWKKLRVA